MGIKQLENEMVYARRVEGLNFSVYNIIKNLYKSLKIRLSTNLTRSKDINKLKLTLELGTSEEQDIVNLLEIKNTNIGNRLEAF